MSNKTLLKMLLFKNKQIFVLQLYFIVLTNGKMLLDGMLGSPSCPDGLGMTACCPTRFNTSPVPPGGWSVPCHDTSAWFSASGRLACQNSGFLTAPLRMLRILGGPFLKANVRNNVTGLE
jgi:hypothetical protein